jgi:hypothetical protein
MGDVRKKSHCSNQSKCSDVGVRERLLEFGGGGENGAALRNDVVDENNSLGRAQRIGHAERIVVLLQSWAVSVECGRGFTDRKTALNTRPNGSSQSNAVQRDGETLGGPHPGR